MTQSFYIVDVSRWDDYLSNIGISLNRKEVSVGHINDSLLEAFCHLETNHKDFKQGDAYEKCQETSGDDQSSTNGCGNIPSQRA